MFRKRGQTSVGLPDLTRRDLLRYGFICGVAGGIAPLSFAASVDSIKPSNATNSFNYINPVETVTMRDCQIVKERDTYYMTGTLPPFWGEAPNPGVGIVQSTDLVNWSRPRILIRPDPARWYQRLFWAPEIFPYDEKFYLTFNCPAGDNEKSPQSVGLAVASVIDGPYTVLTKDRPLTEGNDATLFLDTDGHMYLYATTESGDVEGIACVGVDLSKGAVLGDRSICILKGGALEWDGGENVGIEGPSVFKRNGIYYLMYSSWRRGYEIGYATATHPRGPWKKYAGNPIYGAQDPDVSKKYGGTYDQSESVPFGQVGHGSPFFGPDGRIWFCCHGIMQKNKGRDTEPHLVITPMDFKSDGVIAMDLTWTAQTVPVPATTVDPMWRDSGSPASTG